MMPSDCGNSKHRKSDGTYAGFSLSMPNRTGMMISTLRHTPSAPLVGAVVAGTDVACGSAGAAPAAGATDAVAVAVAAADALGLVGGGSEPVDALIPEAASAAATPPMAGAVRMVAGDDTTATGRGGAAPVVAGDDGAAALVVVAATALGG